MSRKQNTASGVYRYLEMSGVLEHGTAADIAQKRKEYWNERKRLWAREKRARETEIAAYFSDGELSTLSRKAREHRMSRSKFLKLAALAYCKQEFLTPDPASVTYIRHMLALHRAALEEIARQAHRSEIAALALQKITELERMVLAALVSPPLKT